MKRLEAAKTASAINDPESYVELFKEFIALKRAIMKKLPISQLEIDAEKQEKSQ